MRDLRSSKSHKNRLNSLTVLDPSLAITPKDRSCCLATNLTIGKNLHDFLRSLHDCYEGYRYFSLTNQIAVFVTSRITEHKQLI